MEFVPQIILVKDNNIIVSTKKVCFDYTEKDYLLEVTNKDNKTLFKGKPNNETEIIVDVNEELINLRYYDQLNYSILFFEEIIRLKNNETINNNMNNKNFETVSIKNKEGSLLEKVSFEMDNPQGSIDDIQNHTLMLKKANFNKKARLYVENKIRQVVSEDKSLSEIEIDNYVKSIYSKSYGMGVIQELDDVKDVSEILINATIYPNFECNIYYIETNKGKKKYHKAFETKEELLNVFSRAISFSKKEFNSLENAIIETSRANGDRVTLIVPEASDNYILNIRKFSNFVPTIENMIEIGTVNQEIDSILKTFVKGKANIGIGGPMGAGKTTFINYLLTHTEPIERKVIIGSVSEADTQRVLKGHDIVSLNVDDEKGFTFNKLMKTALRTTADRIIIPESRGEEFKQIYEANLKTKGNMFTAHALSDSTFVDICADMYMENSNNDAQFIKNKIAKSIDIIIIMKKINDKIRIKSISEVVLDDNSQFKSLELLYYWDFEDTGNDIKYKRTNNKISDGFRTKLFEEGISKEVLDTL